LAREQLKALVEVVLALETVVKADDAVVRDEAVHVVKLPQVFELVDVHALLGYDLDGDVELAALVEAADDYGIVFASGNDVMYIDAGGLLFGGTHQLGQDVRRPCLLAVSIRSISPIQSGPLFGIHSFLFHVDSWSPLNNASECIVIAEVEVQSGLLELLFPLRLQIL